MISAGSSCSSAASIIARLYSGGLVWFNSTSNLRCVSYSEERKMERKDI